MAAVIRYFRGTVIEFLGDGIFVVFGAPLELLDHASAAVACAIDMQNAMEEVNAWNREHGYPDLEMGIAVNSGTAVVGNIGSEQKMKYGCMGETVNLAGRLESFTLGGEAVPATASREIDYNGKDVDVSIYINNTGEFTKGIYTAEVYTAQGRLGKAETMLR